MAFHKPYMNRKGYAMEYLPDHPRADKRGLVLAHIIAYEKHTGTRVPEGYVIHHINGVKTDNRPENLTMLTVSEHTILHNRVRKYSAETKLKLSHKAKERLKDPTNHPLYLSLDIDAVKADRIAGMSVKDICQKYGFCKATYYTRITGYRRKK